MDETKQQKAPADEDLGIDLYDLFYLFRQKLVGILIALVLGGVVTGLFTYFFIAPKYQATAKLYIVSASNDSVVNLTDLQLGASLTADYEQLVLGRPMLESVLINLHPHAEDIEQLKKMISVSNPSNTRILNITVTSTDPAEAMNIANELARLAIDWLPEVMRSNEPSIAEEAVTPTKKSSPSYVINTLAGALALAVFYYGFELLRRLHDDTIHTGEDLERYFGVVALTSIPEEKGVQDHSEDKKPKRGAKSGRN